MDNGRIMKELKELQEGVKNVSNWIKAYGRDERIWVHAVKEEWFEMLDNQWVDSESIAVVEKIHMLALWITILLMATRLKVESSLHLAEQVDKSLTNPICLQTINKMTHKTFCKFRLRASKLLKQKLSEMI